MQIRLTPGTLPPNYCITSVQEFYNLMMSLGYGSLDTTASIAKVIIGSTEPTPDQRDYVWIRLNPTTLVFDRMYNFVSGRWVSPYRVPTSSNERIFWAGGLASLATYDGGANVAVGDATGPFWEEDTAMRGRFPIGAGTLGSGTVLANGDTGGNEEITIARANLPDEALDVSTKIIGQSTVGSGSQPVVGSDYGFETVSGSGNAVDGTSTVYGDRYYTKGRTEELGDGEELNILPPYYVGFWAKRTSRKYWTPS